MGELFKELIDQTENDFISIAEDGVIAGDITGYVDTGSLALNALISGSLYKGLPNTRVVALAGEPSVGKTFYALGAVKQFLIDNPRGFVFYFETEAALDAETLEKRGVDTSRIAIVPVITVQEFRTQALKILNRYLDEKEKDRPPMMFVLDSLGNLSTQKEVEDIASGKEARDMTRAQLIRGAFRSLTLKLGLAKVPMIITNHTYDVVGAYVPTKKMGGGSGLEYAASIIIFLSKKKDKMLDDEHGKTGNVVTATVKKSRITIDDVKVNTFLHYTTGVDKYYGLLDMAEQFGVVKKVSNKYEFPDGSKAFESQIKKNPEKFFTKEVLDMIEEGCQQNFVFGKENEKEEDNEVSEDNDEGISVSGADSNDL